MDSKFKKFLEDNDAYDKYIINCNGDEPKNPYIEFDAFIWTTTEEGYDFWNNLDDKWTDLWYDEHCDFHDGDSSEEHYWINENNIY